MVTPCSRAWMIVLRVDDRRQLSGYLLPNKGFRQPRSAPHTRRGKATRSSLRPDRQTSPDPPGAGPLTQGRSPRTWDGPVRPQEPTMVAPETKGRARGDVASL